MSRPPRARGWGAITSAVEGEPVSAVTEAVGEGISPLAAKSRLLVTSVAVRWCRSAMRSWRSLSCGERRGLEAKVVDDEGRHAGKGLEAALVGSHGAGGGKAGEQLGLGGEGHVVAMTDSVVAKEGYRGSAELVPPGHQN